jgi:hypothetical protein
MVYSPACENKFLYVPEDGLDDVEFANYQKDRGLSRRSEHTSSCVPEDGLDDLAFSKYVEDVGLLRRSHSLPIALTSRASSLVGTARSLCSFAESSTMASSNELSDTTINVDYTETAYSLLHQVSSDYDDFRNIVTGGKEDGWYLFSTLGHSATPYLGTMFVSTLRISMENPAMHTMSTCSMSMPSASNMLPATIRSETREAGGHSVAPSLEGESATPFCPPAEEDTMDMLEESTPKTTLMLCNLPSQYSRVMVMDLLESEGFAEHVKFIYVPTNLRQRSNFGYAFVNFDSVWITLQCRDKLQGFNRWSEPNEKEMVIEWSDSQSLEANIERYRNSPIMHESVPDELKPALFWRGARVTFPEPTKAIRAPRRRGAANQNHQNNASDV